MSSSDLRSARVAVGRASGLLQSDGFSSSEARHALRQGERLHRVSVYPSDFGLERMAEEARLGPRALFGSAGTRAAAAPGAGNGGGPSGAAAEPEADDDDSPAGSGERLHLPCCCAGAFF